MRTTIDIDDAVLERVRLRAKHERVSTGRMVSELVQRQLDTPPDIVVVNGLPVLRNRKPGSVVTMGQANEMLDELLRAESGL